MSDVVVDSCVAAKWVLTEPDSPKAIQILTDSTHSGSLLFVLDLIFAEVGNAIWKRLARSLITQTEADHYQIAFPTSAKMRSSTKSKLPECVESVRI